MDHRAVNVQTERMTQANDDHWSGRARRSHLIPCPVTAVTRRPRETGGGPGPCTRQEPFVVG